MNDRAIIITGANRGIGRGIAKELARRGRSIIMACRNADSALDTARAIKDCTGNDNIEVMALDLSSFESVASFVDEVRSRKIEVDTLINNAGVLEDHYSRTIDGFEKTIQVNYISQFLLTVSLAPLMRQGGRVINTSSVIYGMGKVDETVLSRDKGAYRRFQAYADSKLAIMLFTVELAERLKASGISVNAVDPGIVDTNILTMNAWIDPLTDVLFRPFVNTEDEGAENSVYVALDPIGSEATGKYFVKRTIRKIPKCVERHPYRARLWDSTEKALGRWTVS